MDTLFGFILQIIGAAVVWFFKGCNGKITDEIDQGPFEWTRSFKTTRNGIISIAIIIVFLGLLQAC